MHVLWLSALNGQPGNRQSYAMKYAMLMNAPSFLFRMRRTDIIEQTDGYHPRQWIHVGFITRTTSTHI